MKFIKETIDRHFIEEKDELVSPKDLEDFARAVISIAKTLRKDDPGVTRDDVKEYLLEKIISSLY